MADSSVAGSDLPRYDVRTRDLLSQSDMLKSPCRLSLSFWAPESPRWLIKQGREGDAHRVFTRIRHMREDDPYIVNELTGVHEQLDRERAMTEGVGFFAPLKELLFMSDMRFRLLLSFGLGAAGQWSVVYCQRDEPPSDSQQNLWPEEALSLRSLLNYSPS